MEEGRLSRFFPSVRRLADIQDDCECAFGPASLAQKAFNQLARRPGVVVFAHEAIYTGFAQKRKVVFMLDQARKSTY